MYAVWMKLSSCNDDVIAHSPVFYVFSLFLFRILGANKTHEKKDKFCSIPSQRYKLFRMNSNRLWWCRFRSWTPLPRSSSERSSQLTQERHADRADARKPYSDATPAATTAESASPATHPPTTDRMPDTKPEASQSKNELSKSSAVRQSVRRRSDSKPTMPSSTDDACKKTSERDEKTVKDTNSSELDGGSTRASRRRKKSQTKLWRHLATKCSTLLLSFSAKFCSAILSLFWFVCLSF